MPDALSAVYGMYSHTGMQYKWKLLILWVFDILSNLGGKAKDI